MDVHVLVLFDFVGLMFWVGLMVGGVVLGRVVGVMIAEFVPVVVGWFKRRFRR